MASTALHTSSIFGERRAPSVVCPDRFPHLCRVTEALKFQRPDGADDMWSEIPTLVACRRLVQHISQSSKTREALLKRWTEICKEERDRATEARMAAAAAATAVTAVVALNAPTIEPTAPEELLEMPAEPDIDQEALTHLEHARLAVTQWSSAYRMMKRMFKLRHACAEVLADEFRALEEGIDWRTVEGLLKLLEPFYEATQTLQDKHHPIISRLWYFVLYMRFTLEKRNFSAYSPEVIGVRDRLLLLMNKVPVAGSNDSVIVITPFIKMCTLLDPTQKVWVRSLSSSRDNLACCAQAAHAFAPVAEVNAAWQLLREKLEELEPPAPTVATQPQPIDEEDFLGQVAARLAREQPRISIEQELQEYRAAKVMPAMSALEWWRSYRASYPRIARLARMFLCVPASAMASEHAFPQLSPVVARRTARHDDRLIARRAFTRLNLPLVLPTPTKTDGVPATGASAAVKEG
jgi:hypothetical protein